MPLDITELLSKSSQRHDHLCPRQVLGVRIGVAGLGLLGLQVPVRKSTALILAESDGCFADGLEVATGATLGHRTLHIRDFGKLAATFTDVATGRAVRLSPGRNIRERAMLYAPHEARRYFAQLQG